MSARVEFDPELCKLNKIRVELIDTNQGLRNAIIAIKTSTGQVAKHGLKRYFDYPERKQKEAREWLRGAAKGFPSVLEHWTLTFYIEGCSRLCSHQLVRHRLVSFTQESTRYTAEWLLAELGGEGDQVERIMNAKRMLRWLENEILRVRPDDPKAVEEAVQLVREELGRVVVIPNFKRRINILRYALHTIFVLDVFLEMLLDREDLENARYLLPMSIKTRLIATANLREWLHIVKLRDSPAASWEIRCVARQIREKIAELLGFDPLSEEESAGGDSN